MNHPRLILLFVVGALAGVLLAAPAKPSPGESALIRQRIDALLKKRQKPEPLPAEPPNPFALASALAGGPAPTRETPQAGEQPAAAIEIGSADESAPASTAELLARFSSRLRITGIIRLKGQVHVIINDSPWKEGDYMILNQGTGIIRLQVMRIQPGQLTLRLEDAELVLKF